MMALGDERSQRILSQLNENEVRRLGAVMSRVGRTNVDAVKNAISEFKAEVEHTFIVGDVEATEKMLRRSLPLDKVLEIMDDIRDPGRRTIWEVLSQMQPQTLAGYLRGEYPQTAAVILANLPAPQAARVIKLLPDGLAAEVALRLVRMQSIQKSVLADIEETLRREFNGEMTRSSERDGAAVLAEMLNRSAPEFADRILARIDETDPQTAAWVRRMMFTFEDLRRIDPSTIGTLIAECPVEQIPIALANASETVRSLFLSQMSARAAKILQEEMETMPLPRRKVIDQAQADIMVLAKRLLDEGRLQLIKLDDEGIEDEYDDAWSTR